MHVTIDRNKGIYTIWCDSIDAKCRYLFCTERQALKRFRIEYGLERKHLNVTRIYSL